MTKTVKHILSISYSKLSKAYGCKSTFTPIKLIYSQNIKCNASVARWSGQDLEGMRILIKVIFNYFLCCLLVWHRNDLYFQLHIYLLNHKSVHFLTYSIKKYIIYSNFSMNSSIYIIYILIHPFIHLTILFTSLIYRLIYSPI